MVNKAMMRALWTVRAAVRMRMLAERVSRNLDPEIGDATDADGRDADGAAFGKASHASAGMARNSYMSAARTSLADAPDHARLSDPLLARASHAGLLHPASERPAPLSARHELKLVVAMLSSSYASWLLLFVPIGFAAGLLGWHPVTVFVTNFIALIPLALLLGDVTEDLAARFGDVVGGLLNATFGNVVEVVLAVQALRKQLYMVVAMSLIGSILSNLLLVLGCSMLVGGIFHHQQFFNTDSTQVRAFASVEGRGGES
uniref:Sodium/calcium exchanger membrane region domain-containing protein n=1 Tax=Chlamydomonas euryale TaxID=1486919 RepID=A0A7R9VQK9_9CHLO|mmetsp:Transcript_41121/g.122755  ORF Transcript_41121/g.122755 Transcript_41121/m.122755 type:complete len:259 (+) Transcript_41121:269-1045(+)